MAANSSAMMVGTKIGRPGYNAPIIARMMTRFNPQRVARLRFKSITVRFLNRPVQSFPPLPCTQGRGDGGEGSVVSRPPPPPPPPPLPAAGGQPPPRRPPLYAA